MKAQESIHGVVDVMGARDRFLGTSQGQSKKQKGAQTDRAESSIWSSAMKVEQRLLALAPDCSSLGSTVL